MAETEKTASDKKVSKESPAQIEDMAYRFWSCSNNCEAVRELSHWFDVGVWKSENRLEKSGQRHLEMFRKLCEKNLKPLWEKRSMLEWGPGGGGNAVAFAPHMNRFVGVDISVANLEECIRQFAARDLLRHTVLAPVIVDISTPETVLDILGARVDFFLSTAVYQHFPSMEYGVRVTKIANKVLTPDGLAIIQTRLNDGSEFYHSKEADYVNSFAAFTCYTLEEFTQIAQNCGFEVQETICLKDLRYAYYLLKKTHELE